MPAPPPTVPAAHPRTLGWLGTTALAMGGSNQSLFLIAGGTGLFATQGSAAVPLLVLGLLLSWAALPGWIELVLMWPNRVGGIAATCAEAFRPISPVLANLTGVCYWWGWVPTCGLTAILSATAIHTWYLPGVPVTPLACALVAGFTLVNLGGIRWVVRLALPLATGSALLAFLSGVLPVLSGAVNWEQATTFHLVTPFPGVFGAVTSAMAGLYLIGFAAPAFEQATCHVGETRDPNVQVPRAVFASAGMATLYFLVLPLVWLGVLGPAGMLGDLQNSLGPTFAPIFGHGARAAAIWFMTLNMFHGTLAPLAGATRTLSQLAEDGLLPRTLARRNRFDVPWVATVGTAAMAILFLLLGDPVWLIAAANLCYLIGIGLPSVAVWLLRRQAPEMARPYRAPRGTIGLGVAAAATWAVSAVLGFQQFGLPTVLAGIALAYSGSLLFAVRRWRDARRSGQRRMPCSLHVKLTGAMLLVLVFDGAGYLLAVNSVDPSQVVLKTVLEDIFVAVALLTVSAGLVLPGIISHAMREVARAADRLATGTLADFSHAMQALAQGKLDEAHARVDDLTPVVVSSRDEVGAMALSFNEMQRQVVVAAAGLDGAREGLRTMRDTLRYTNRRLEERVQERTDALAAAWGAEERLQAAHAQLETRVRERTAALAGANDALDARAHQQAAVAELGQRALESGDLPALMDRAARLLATMLAVGWTAILELSRDGRELRLRAGVGWEPGLVGTYTAPADHSTPAGHALLIAEPLVVEDTRRERLFNATPHMRDSGIASAILVHIGGDQNPFGVLSAYAREPRSFTQDDVYFVLAVANVLAAAIQRKRAEEAMRVSQEEAERANLAKSEFLSRMSHELRTPLNAILGFGQLLEMDTLPAGQTESVEHILKAGRHLLGLIDEVLDISRIEAGRLDLTLAPLRVADLLDDALGLVQPLARPRRVRLERAGGDSSVHVLADAQRLKQVLLNLLSNAVKYNREGGEVRVGWGPAPGDPARVQLTVGDTGAGIPAERRGELFSPFARLGAERSGVEGTGLGLALSKRLVEAQDGTLTFESEPGAGTTFTVTLPRAAAPAPVPVAPGGPPLGFIPPGSGENARPADDGATRRVLLVEDNLSNLELVRCLLERERNVRLLVAMQGRLGLEMAFQHRPDLILLDLHLPDVSGEEVLHRLQVNPATCDIPVVMVSADAIPAQAASLRAAGAADYLTKPLDVKRFLEVVHGYLHGAKPGEEAGAIAPALALTR